jgi:hypothetical protein
VVGQTQRAASAIKALILALLTIKEAADELRVSQQWLKYWLAANPVDVEGVPFYVRMGSRLKFEPKDVQRILAHLRALEATRLGPSVKSKARLVGLMSQVGGYDHLVAVREAAERRKQEAKMPRRRISLPRHKKPDPQTS